MHEGPQSNDLLFYEVITFYENNQERYRLEYLKSDYLTKTGSPNSPYESINNVPKK